MAVHITVVTIPTVAVMNKTRAVMIKIVVTVTDTMIVITVTTIKTTKEGKENIESRMTKK